MIEENRTNMEPVAFRHSYDGYGWDYTDNGSGSSWQTIQKPDKEYLYLKKDRISVSNDQIVALWREKDWMIHEFARAVIALSQGVPYRED
jgi:hypothetical protein